jgi:hypothetical protein
MARLVASIFSRRAVGEESSALRGQGFRSADDLDAQGWLTTQFPEDARADLGHLAVITRQLDERLTMGGEEGLQFAMDLSLADGLSRWIAEAELDEGIGIDARQVRAKRNWMARIRRIS